jgi:hypothetical protein
MPTSNADGDLIRHVPLMQEFQSTKDLTAQKVSSVDRFAHVDRPAQAIVRPTTSGG